MACSVLKVEQNFLKVFMWYISTSITNISVELWDLRIPLLMIAVIMMHMTITAWILNLINQTWTLCAQDSRILSRRCWLVYSGFAGGPQLWDVYRLQGCVPRLFCHEHVVPDFLHSHDQCQKQPRTSCCRPQWVSSLVVVVLYTYVDIWGKSLNIWIVPPFWILASFIDMFYYCSKMLLLQKILFQSICGSEFFMFLSCLSLCRCWLIKFAALVGLSVAAFYIPDQPFTYCKCKSFADSSCLGRWEYSNKFSVYLFITVWFIVGSAGAFFFVLIQLVLLVDFAHSLNESWVEKMETGNASIWYIGEQLNLRKCLSVSVDTVNAAFSSNLCC